MINVAAPVLPDASTLAGLVREHLDDLVTYATHLVGDVDDAVEFVAGGIYHASRYPPARLQTDGRVALYRAVTRACRQEHRFPPRPHGPARFFREEVERVSTLGRVTVADHSVEQLLVQLGLAEPAEEDTVHMTGTPMHGDSFWEPPALAVPDAVPPAPPLAAAAPPPSPVRQW